MKVFLCAVLIATTPKPKGAVSLIKCFHPNLYVRTEATPRSVEFNLGAIAFDRATKDWEKRSYAQAARGFMEATAHFAADGNAEGNWRSAWQNAALAFEAANQVPQGRVAFEAAAAKEKSAEHAEALRAAGAKLDSSHACP
jgi:hypothetical protein